ncbi:hypothetical protein MYCTH_2299991 [Thermothelomyces thermophilus ATCC 42464]|uniref:Uncharacterized protein n=1 Tax=Thermothelomyces thermophilus (strain ATCC 42464 / BCRC 31852 / DSM 1799) TaxID=573729 RepID=G2QA53_THET4|nr:uncharacterized protein MYCTH_2299991 [Thermothelomyces thermophilus ATCC 42464]AEO55801.1 hypothetical protein MYCTH_2299991 [Thermothelomyces thermophilus ATCC 42464]
MLVEGQHVERREDEAKVLEHYRNPVALVDNKVSVTERGSIVDILACGDSSGRGTVMSKTAALLIYVSVAVMLSTASNMYHAASATPHRQ